MRGFRGWNWSEYWNGIWLISWNRSPWKDDPRFVVHFNTALIRADSPEDACEKAPEPGAGRDVSYRNPEDKRVTIAFRGLQDLNVIHDYLEHGAELVYRATIETDEAEIQKYIYSKEQLGVFSPRKVSKGPNYISKDVLRGMNELMGRDPNTMLD